MFEVWGERRENVSSGSEFCWSWPSFSCPSLTEQIVKEKENITLCCPGFHEDTEGNCIEMNEEDTGEENSTSTSLKFNFNCIGDCECSEEGCEDNNLLYLLVIVPLIIVVILILVLVYCIYKMKAKLRTLRDQRSSQGRQNEESTENHQKPGRDKIVNNSLYYDNSGFCTDKNINKDSTARVSVQNNETNVKEKKPLKSEKGKTVNNPLYNFDNSGFCTISEKIINKEATVKVALHKGIIMINVLSSTF